VIDVLWVVLVIGGCGLALWGASKIEPHWVSKDGRKFIASVQLIGKDGGLSRPQEVRGAITDRGEVWLRSRRRIGRFQGFWMMAGASPEPPRGKRVYLLRGEPDVALRVPTSSKLVERLEALAQG
jgi:hypothetical protein